MNVGGDSWRRLWGELGAGEIPGGVYNQLVAACSERHRHYHTLQHLRECLAHFEAAAPLARHPAEVELALWFHDAVYDPRRHDNEELSAGWAQRTVVGAGCDAAIAGRVHALVMATKGHSASDDPDTALLLDVDLAILGAAGARFQEYERQVRAEYAHVPDAEFHRGRAAVLAGFEARPRIYLTAPFHDALEARARANLRQSQERLKTLLP
ncbi:MAG TPA: N-methyl-D-aspartate receptor NMDAR2C subunit [Ramlibacter sp.]|uniref:HD domain-containing protein n=1 Tax=Ramlibacter sp. TaxID=1917967 RepID=UPI002ED2A1ED